jgi:hypothetical protein
MEIEPWLFNSSVSEMLGLKYDEGCFIRFEVTAVVIFWDIAVSSTAQDSWPFGGGGMFLRNVGLLIPNYTARTADGSTLRCKFVFVYFVCKFVF